MFSNVINNESPMKYFEKLPCFSLYVASRLVMNVYGNVLKPLELTYPQFLVLVCLSEQDNISVDEIGHKLYLDSGTLSPTLKRLEQKGLITRKRSEKDERRLIVSLTEQGLAIRGQTDRICTSVLNQGDLSAEESQQLTSLLKTLITALSRNQ